MIDTIVPLLIFRFHLITASVRPTGSGRKFGGPGPSSGRNSILGGGSPPNGFGGNMGNPFAGMNGLGGMGSMGAGALGGLGGGSPDLTNLLGALGGGSGKVPVRFPCMNTRVIQKGHSVYKKRWHNRDSFSLTYQYRPPPFLTFFQTTNFRPFPIKRVCRRQF